MELAIFILFVIMLTTIIAGFFIVYTKDGIHMLDRPYIRILFYTSLFGSSGAMSILLIIAGARMV